MSKKATIELKRCLDSGLCFYSKAGQFWLCFYSRMGRFRSCFISNVSIWVVFLFKIKWVNLVVFTYFKRVRLGCVLISNRSNLVVFLFQTRQFSLCFISNASVMLVFHCKWVNLGCVSFQRYQFGFVFLFQTGQFGLCLYPFGLCFISNNLGCVFISKESHKRPAN